MSIKYHGNNSLSYLLTLLNTKFGTKVDKVEGKGLSTNDYTTAEKNKLSGIAASANNYTHPQAGPSGGKASGLYKVTVDANGHVTAATDVVKKDITDLGIPGSAPTKTSDLTNDSGFITSSDVPEGAVASTTSPKMDGTANAGSETAFARGDHIHPTDTSRLSTTGDGKDVTVTFTAASTRANVATGEKLSVILGKISKMYSDLKTVAFTGSYNDLTNKPTIPTVPTISTSIDSDATSDIKTASPKAVKTYVDGKISSTYKPAGSVAFASLPTLSASLLGNVYNVTDAFTTTANFLEGAGKSHPAGTNVVVIDSGSSTYKFDVLAGFVDLSGYVQSTDMVEYTNQEVQAMWDAVFTS